MSKISSISNNVSRAGSTSQRIKATVDSWKTDKQEKILIDKGILNS